MNKHSIREKNKGSRSILRKLNFEDEEKVVSEICHHEGANRPPESIGIFKELIIKRAEQTPSEKKLRRRLYDDPNFREVSDIEAEQKSIILCS